MRSRLRSAAGLFRVDLPRAVLVIQVGTAVNAFGFGVILPFEIVYLHEIRGFGLTTSGLVLSTVMGTGALTGPPVGALLDKAPVKAVLLAASAASAVGYGLLAFVDRPWQAFLCSVTAGVGFGATVTAGPTLTMSLLSPEQRPSSFALSRVATNLGIGAGALVAGLIVGGGGHLRSFQALYLLDTASYVAFALLLLVAVRGGCAASATSGDPAAAGNFRAVARDERFLVLLLANVVLVIVGYSLFGNLMGAYAKAHTHIATRAIGALFLVNTVFIVLAQLPATRLAERMRRSHALASMCAMWTLACLAVLPAAQLSSPAAVAFVLIGVSIAFAVGECFHAIVLGPIVVELAPAPLLARYLSLYSLTFTLGLGLGPALGGALLAASPNAVWIVGGIAAGVVGLGFVALGHELPAATPALAIAAEPE